MIRILAMAVTASSPDYQIEIVEVLERRANHGQLVRTISKQPPRNFHSQLNLGLLHCLCKTIAGQKVSGVMKSPVLYII